MPLVVSTSPALTWLFRLRDYSCLRKRTELTARKRAKFHINRSKLALNVWVNPIGTLLTRAREGPHLLGFRVLETVLHQ